jgi:hypothetical protein
MNVADDSEGGINVKGYGGQVQYTSPIKDRI